MNSKKKNATNFANESTSEESDDNSDYESDDSKDLSDDAEKNKSEPEESESEEESDSESEDSENEEFDHKWQELRNEAPEASEITRRIAVCNMDWDRIRAIDLLVCFDSFKPANGSVNSVKVFPSEFGLKRMEEEKMKGPPELIEKTLAADEEEVETKKGSKFHREKLRQYQINRLKYYYAVVECDTPETANTLYEQLNGMEYENCGVRFDLRFIPDDMTFDHEPTSSADKLPNPLEYKPRLFVTTALQQAKVDLTWDETEPRRREFFQKIFTDPDSVEQDLQDFIASASSESEDEIDAAEEESNKKLSTAQRIAKYRELLKSIEEQENEEKNKYDIEVTWESGLKEKTEEKVKEKIKQNTLNPFEELLQKKKENKKLKKKEQKLAQKQESEDSNDSEELDTSNMCVSEAKPERQKKLAELALISDSKNEEIVKASPTKRKRKIESEELEGFVPNYNDPRFSAMHKSSLFNVIPSDHQPKKDRNFGYNKQKDRKFKSKNYESKKGSKRSKYH